MPILYSPPAIVATADRFVSLCASPPAKVGYGGQVCVNCAIIIEGYNTKGHKEYTKVHKENTLTPRDLAQI